MNLENVLAHYVKLRDRLAELEAEHKERVAPIKRDMEQIENALQKHMQETGTTSIKTKAGTAYLQEQTKAQVTDWDAALQYIVHNGEFRLLERRIAKTALIDTGQEVPGVDLVRTIRTNIRRS